MSSDNQDPSTPTPSPSSARAKLLRKIPPIPIRRVKNDEVEDDNNNGDQGDKELSENEESAILLASSLGLNHIKTRSVPSPSPLRFSSSAGFPNLKNEAKKDKVNPETVSKFVVPTESKTARVMMESGSQLSIFIGQYGKLI